MITPRVKQLDALVTERMGFREAFPVTGQTYPRKQDSQVMHILSEIAASAHKFSSDLRLLQSVGEIEEPFEADQVGSSAMAYKRNPMRSERMAGLARYVMTTALNAPLTEATQWFERTLDDSSNRRLLIPEAFLATDAVLRLYLNVVRGLVVNPAVIARRVAAGAPLHGHRSPADGRGQGRWRSTAVTRAHPRPFYGGGPGGEGRRN